MVLSQNEQIEANLAHIQPEKLQNVQKMHFLAKIPQSQWVKFMTIQSVLSSHWS